MVEGAQLGALARQGGDDTWYGPTAAAFLEDCRAVDRLVDEAVDGLRRAGRATRPRGARLERLALATGPLTGA